MVKTCSGRIVSNVLGTWFYCTFVPSFRKSTDTNVHQGEARDDCVSSVLDTT